MWPPSSFTRPQHPAHMDTAGLIVGLGNPGPRYAPTRHNVGFMLVDSVVAEAQDKTYRRLRQLRRQDDLELWSVSLPRCKGDFLLLKPLTYMNLSGKAALRVCMEFGVSPKAMLVVHDELDLPLGRLKFKQGGGTAGHNGLKSLVAELGTDAFARLRLGIGRPPREVGVSDWVLADFGPAEQPVVATRSISSGRSCVMCTATSLGESSPRRSSRASGRTPCCSRDWFTSKAVSCTCMCTGRSSSSASMAMRSSERSDTVYGACGAKAVRTRRLCRS